MFALRTPSNGVFYLFPTLPLAPPFVGQFWIELQSQPNG
jgi:hypothetical protein